MLAILLGIFAAFCWSLHDLVARSYAERIGAFRMAALVMISGGLLLSPYVLYRGAVWQTSPEALGLSLLLGIAYGFGVGGLFKAFSLGPISLVGPLTAGYPVLAVLWGVANGLEPSALQWAALAVTLVGAVIVARAGPADGGVNAVAPGKLPTLFGFAGLSVLGYSAAIIIGQNAAVAMGEFEATWVSRTTAVLILLPFLAGEAKPARLEARHWAGIFAMGALDVAGLVAVSASGHLPGREFAAIGISSYGALAVVMAMVVLKEKVSAGQWLGIAMIVGSVGVVSLSQG